MSAINTSIYVCKNVPLDNRYVHTLYFGSKEEQEAYFTAHIVPYTSFTGYTFARKTWDLKLNASYDAAREWCYLFFKNGNKSKYYYYFINSVEYISDNAVNLKLELDVIQSYMFDWQLMPCYVDREHSETDEIGENTLDEGLDCGELINKYKLTYDLCDNIHVLVASSMDIAAFYISQGATEKEVVSSNIDNLFGGFQISSVAKENWSTLGDMLSYLNNKGKIDSVFTMWHYPGELITSNNGAYENAIAEYVTGSEKITWNLPYVPGETIDNIDGYIPKNKKLFQYPYCFLYMTNNSGGAAVYHFHHFASDKPSFEITGNIAPDATIKLTPLNYKGVEKNHDESLNMVSFPLASWNNDPYKLWLAQNQNQNALGFITNGLKIVAGIGMAAFGAVQVATGVGAVTGTASAVGGASMVDSGIQGIMGQLAQQKDMDIQPPQARGNLAGSHNVSQGIQNFDAYVRTVDATHAEIIDKFFTMYGYACRKVKIPNINKRPAFNYVKTIGSNISGNFCHEDLRRINEIFDKGITFWKNGAIGDYTQNNAPVSTSEE